MSGKSDKESDLKITEVLKKVLTAGVGAAFMTEDAVKGLLADLPLPKDILNGLLSMAKNSKEDFINSVKSEFKKYLSNIDLNKEIDRILEKYDFEVTASIRLKKKESKHADD